MHSRLPEPKVTLQSMEVHDSWTRHFRTRENESFFNQAFDFVSSTFGAPGKAPVVDAGCGSGTKSRLLASRGFHVHALDFSKAILNEARKTTGEAQLEKHIEFEQADLTALPLATGSIHRCVCWGVLMHIPNVEVAVTELCRIMAPGGILIVSEGNVRSLQARALRALKRLMGRERARLQSTPAGLEHWEETSVGPLMTRQADLPWMVATFERQGMKLITRRAGQFTEIYTGVPWRWVRLAIHLFNNFWFRRIQWPGPAFGNICVFVRQP
jgi:ubiquinone/menaquinone biosynthesis C-methylase UbiE